MSHQNRYQIMPPGGVMKINVDLTLSKNIDKVAIAAVVGGEAGDSMVVLEGMSDPDKFEAIAWSEGLVVATDLLLCRFCDTMECSNVVWSI
jgi:hypothetical protein